MALLFTRTVNKLTN